MSRTILVANDDGIYSPGIKALANAMASLGTVNIVAPDVEQSGVGHGITVRRPLRMRKTQLNHLEPNVTAYRVDGTPTDCVVMGVHVLGRPDLVVSGINFGPNLGYDLTHSGTFACAIEGTHLGIPSIAFSLQFSDEMDFSHGAVYAAKLARAVLERGLPAKTVLNVNFPVGRPLGVRVTVQGTHHYEDAVDKRLDPDGQPYYWVGGKPTGDEELDSDYGALNAGFVSVTPLYMDFTRRDYLETVRGFAPNLESDG
jgi:5'-nucleotidase